jgi:hypothetical protein
MRGAVPPLPTSFLGVAYNSVHERRNFFFILVIAKMQFTGSDDCNLHSTVGFTMCAERNAKFV